MIYFLSSFYRKMKAFRRVFGRKNPVNPVSMHQPPPSPIVPDRAIGSYISTALLPPFGPDASESFADLGPAEVPITGIPVGAGPDAGDAGIQKMTPHLTLTSSVMVKKEAENAQRPMPRPVVPADLSCSELKPRRKRKNVSK